jgi:AcrR family transcriptional regulator
MSEPDSAIPYPRRAKRKRETRERILIAAVHLFRAKGYSETMLADIAADADIHIATLFTHFKSKKDISSALADAAIAQLEEVVQEARAQRIPFFDFVRALVREWASAEQSAPMRNLSYGYALRTDPEIAFSWLQYQNRELALYAEYIADEYGLDAATDNAPHLVAAMISRGNVMVLDHWLDAKGRTDLKRDALAAIVTAEELVRDALERMRAQSALRG